MVFPSADGDAAQSVSSDGKAHPLGIQAQAVQPAACASA